MKKDRNPIKPILSNPALNDEKVYNERRYTVHAENRNLISKTLSQCTTLFPQKREVTVIPIAEIRPWPNYYRYTFILADFEMKE